MGICPKDKLSFWTSVPRSNYPLDICPKIKLSSGHLSQDQTILWTSVPRSNYPFGHLSLRAFAGGTYFPMDIRYLSQNYFKVQNQYKTLSNFSVAQIHDLLSLLNGFNRYIEVTTSP